VNRSKKVVLVIEDDAETVVLLNLLLRRRHLQVVSMLPGEECVPEMEALQPDLVLLDIMMPGMDGWEVYQRMKASAVLQDTPIVVITVRSQETARMEGQTFDEIAGYVRKPFQPRTFLQMVDRLLTEKGDGAHVTSAKSVTERIEKE
jgi:CheY-like chemotaxis protein